MDTELLKVSYVYVYRIVFKKKIVGGGERSRNTDCMAKATVRAGVECAPSQLKLPPFYKVN